MPSKTAEPRSISAQLVLLFTFSAALVLSCALVVFYWIVVQHAVEEDNAVLKARVRALRAELREPNGLETMQQQLQNHRAGEAIVEWVRVLENSAVAAATADMDRLLPASVFPSGENSKLTVDYRASGRRFALFTAAEKIGLRQYTIQFAQDRSADEQFRRKFGALLAVSVALGTLASALIGISVTRRGLRPLRAMTDAVKKITPIRLDVRLGAPRWPNELQPLAIAFDQMLDRLENSFTRLSQFSADLAHELRTPIANMLGEAQVGLSRDRAAEEYRHIIESSVGECERLSAIVDNLLFLARAESAENQIQCSVFDARPLADKIASYWETVADDRNVKISCSGDAEMFADQSLVERALNNLVENALRFTPDGGKITISIASLNGETAVAVQDNGAGIPAEHLPRVFDRFYRVDPARNSGGSGLGLALVQSIVDLHGGTADIRSEVGRGTVVTLRFPKSPSAS
jgi:two-component system heavy metal sensor histidine kinase CusS